MPDNGDPTGSRRWLAQHGITYGLVYTGEALRKGGHIADPDRPETPIRNGAIFGVRTTIAY